MACTMGRSAVGGKAKSPEGAISLVWVDTPGWRTASARKWPTTRMSPEDGWALPPGNDRGTL